VNYAASKAGMTVLIKVLAKEFAGKGMAIYRIFRRLLLIKL